MYNAAIKNWRTTLAGMASGLVTGMIVGYQNGAFELNWKSVGCFAAFTLCGILQKDFNISNSPTPTAVGNKLPDYIQAPITQPGPYSAN